MVHQNTLEMSYLFTGMHKINDLNSFCLYKK